MFPDAITFTPPSGNNRPYLANVPHWFKGEGVTATLVFTFFNGQGRAVSTQTATFNGTGEELASRLTSSKIPDDARFARVVVSSGMVRYSPGMPAGIPDSATWNNARVMEPGHEAWLTSDQGLVAATPFEFGQAAAVNSATGVRSRDGGVLVNFDEEPVWDNGEGEITLGAPPVAPPPGYTGTSFVQMKRTSGQPEFSALLPLSFRIEELDLMEIACYVDGVPVPDTDAGGTSYPLGLIVGLVSSDNGVPNDGASADEAYRLRQGWNIVRISRWQWLNFFGSATRNSRFVGVSIKISSSLPVNTTAWVAGARIRSGRVPTVSFVFDDGLASVMDLAKPILDAAGFRATIGLVGQTLGDTTRQPGGTYDAIPYATMTGAEIRSLYNQGWDLVNHTDGHLSATDTGWAASVAACRQKMIDQGLTRNNCHNHFVWVGGAGSRTGMLELQRLGFYQGFRVGEEWTTSNRFMLEGSQVLHRWYGERFNAGHERTDALAGNSSLATMRQRIREGLEVGGNMVIMLHEIYDGPAGVDSGTAPADLISNSTGYLQALVDEIKKYADAGLVRVLPISEAWQEKSDLERTPLNQWTASPRQLETLPR